MTYLNVSRYINALWRNSQRSHYNTFVHNMQRVDMTQQAKLREYMEAARHTAYGSDHKFSKIDSYERYAGEVPIIESYDTIQQYIDRIANGESDVLTIGQPLFFESTSGSSARKLIPYTDRLKSEFQSAVDSWLYQLAIDYPSAFHGRSYWSISPPLKSKETTAGGVRVGMESDTEYLNPLMAKLVGRVLAVPDSISQITERNAFYIETWIHLLKHRNLSFISVWSPQFLLTLVRFLFEHIDEIYTRTSRDSRKLLSNLSLDDFQLRSIFERLVVISCWTDGQATMWIEELKQMSRGIPLHSKGLLLTEGVISTPISATEQVLSYTSHFYEFRSSDGTIHLASQLEKGERYEVIMSTGGGLYRYNTHDLVRCDGYRHEVPVLKFLGRAKRISDMVGEKLSEIYVAEVFEKIIKLHSSVHNMIITPVKEATRAHYRITYVTKGNTQEIEHAIESELRKSIYFDQALSVGQLDKLQFEKISTAQFLQIAEKYREEKGIRDGDFKMPYIFL